MIDKMKKYKARIFLCEEIKFDNYKSKKEVKKRVEEIISNFNIKMLLKNWRN